MPTWSLWLRWAIAAAVLSPMLATPVQEARADGVTRPDDKPDQPGKKKPPKKKGKGGKDKKGPKFKGPFEKDEYPIPERLRPLVLPANMGEITVAPGYLRAPVSEGVDFVTTDVAFDYGLGDVVELGLGSGLQLAPDVDWSNQISAHVHWLAVDEKDFDLAPGVVVPLTFAEDAAQHVYLDAYGRYLAGDMFFLTFGRRVFDIGVNPDFTLTMNANGGFGVQLSRPAVLWLDTTVLSLPLAPDPAISGPWETLTLALGGQYTPTRTIDLGLVLSYAETWDLDGSSGLGLRAYGSFRF